MTHRTKVKPYVVTSASGLPIADNPSASIELLDAGSGFIPNRMTTDQRDVIVQPEEAMLIYNTDIPGFQYFTSGAWTDLTGSGGGVTIPDDLTVVELTATTSISSPEIGTADLQCEGTILASRLLVGDVSISSNLSLGIGQYVDFVVDDPNWRLGYGLAAFSTTLVGASTNFGIVIGSGSSGPDGFAVGQTNGQSIFELDGETKNAFFAGSVGIGVVGSGFALAVSGGVSADSYTTGDWSLATTHWPGQGGILFTGDDTVNFGISSNGSGVQANLWIDGIINQQEVSVTGASNYFAERVGVKKASADYDLDVAGQVNSAGYLTNGDRFPGEPGAPTAPVSATGSIFFDPDTMHFTANTGGAVGNSFYVLFTMPSGPNVALEGTIYSDHVQIILASDSGGNLDDSTNTYDRIGALFNESPISFLLDGDGAHSLHPDVGFFVALSGGVDGTPGYDGKLMWDTDNLYISVGTSTENVSNWYMTLLTKV